MAEIGKLWAGRVYGTNTGNIFVSIERSDDGLRGTLRFMDSAFGLVVYAVQGTFSEGTLDLTGEPNQAPDGIQTGQLKAQARLTPEGSLRGSWQTSLGTAGTFELFPHDAPSDQTRQLAGSIPEQLHTTRISIGAVRLFADDIHELAALLRKDFSSGKLIATYKSGGVENVRYFDDFEKDAHKNQSIQYLKLSLQEPEAHGINKLAVIELDSEGRNDVITQGIYESWVVGKAESVARHVRRHENSLVTNVKKFGLGLNQIIFGTMLVFIPEIETLERRAIFAAIVFGLLMALVWAHQRFLPNVVLYMAPRKPGLLARAWPAILSWVIAATASLAAAVAFYLLTKSSP